MTSLLRGRLGVPPGLSQARSDAKVWRKMKVQGNGMEAKRTGEQGGTGKFIYL